MDDNGQSLIDGYLARGWALVALHDVASGTCSCGRADCQSGNAGKHPLYPSWQKMPIRDRAVLDAIMLGRPSMNIGILTGAPSKMWVLDVDPDNGGDASLAELEREHGALPRTWQQRTGSGGWHHAWLMPRDFEPTNSTGRLPPGLDVRGTGGQIVVAPSRTLKGPYAPFPADLIPAPGWLEDLVRPVAYERGDAVEPTLADEPRARAYAAAAIRGACEDLAGESSSRNSTAFRVACRLHEIINAGWIDYESTHQAYLLAAERASTNKHEPFPPSEAELVWTHAASRVGDGAASLPPPTLGGEGLDFASASVGGSADLSTDAADIFDTYQQVGTPVSVGDNAQVCLTLPLDFWESRPVLKHIRQAAHARIVSADVVLHSVLTRLASLWPHTVRLDTGVKSPASANLFSIILGPSGAGKTSGVSVARKLLPRPPWMEEEDYGDALPLGTGEGIAEAYMGMAWRPSDQVDANGLPIIDAKTGAPKLEKVRTQVRHNVYLTSDEGRAMTKIIERVGSTLGETLCSAWVGATIGQSNGRAETTRIIRDGRYSLGMVVGFQEETVMPLLRDNAAGTPQRFVWASATDPAVPSDPVEDPGPLRGIWMAARLPPGEGSGPWLADPGGGVDEREVTFAASIRAELRAEHIAIQHGARPAVYDEHRSLTRVKLAVLLAALEGRRSVSEDDWRLSEVMWDTSAKVRDHALSHGRVVAGKEHAAKRAVHADLEGAAEVAKLDIRDARQTAALERMAIRLVHFIASGGSDGVTHRSVMKTQSNARRGMAAEALGMALERRWVEEPSPGMYRAGPVAV